MTASRRQTGSDNTFARSTGDAAMRGALLIGAAVIIGLLLLWKAVIADDGGTKQVTTGPTTTAVAGATTVAPGAGVTTLKAGATTAPVAGATTVPVATVTTHPPAQVQVLIANGSSTNGLASKVTDKLKTQSYATLAPSNATQSPKSYIYFKANYEGDARAIAALFTGLPAAQVVALPDGNTVGLDAAGQKLLPGASVIVIAGVDGLIKA
jgi:hypothetical protein